MLLAASAPAPARLLVSVTEVRPTEAILWARAARAGEVRVEVGTTVGDAGLRLTREAVEAEDLLVRVPLDALAPATRHRYRVVQDGERVDGEFTTAPTPDVPARVTFLWSGDLGGGGSHCRSLDGGYRIFRAMAQHAADFFLFVGDTIYADALCNRPDTVPGANFRAKTLAEYRARHRYNREDPAFQEFLRRTPVFATWDDHEVRNDFAGPSEPRMPNGRQAFIDYWPVAAGGDDPHRLYRRARWGRLLELFILDTRQYRSDNSLPDGPVKTMLGAAQRRWLLEAVPASTATWKVVVSSVPLAIPTGRPDRRDSWTDANVLGLAPENGTGFVTERDAILRHFRMRDVKNLVFIAADVHHAEVIRHQPYASWSFHELIAGPLSAGPGRPRPLDVRLGPRSLYAQGGVLNFGEVTIEPAQLTVRAIDDQGHVLFTHTIAPE
ncbi:MAG TPA: alkaline phosphatase D family protein [Methylomirabilota bacterium]|nr:alkaline phosphatase D family protein [Methylomirabilota bacterium]